MPGKKVPKKKPTRKKSGGNTPKPSPLSKRKKVSQEVPEDETYTEES